MSLRFIGASTGRAGSVYIARVMQKAGIACLHETHFRADHYNPGPAPWEREEVGEWSAQVVPFLDRYRGAVRIWHQVRHPLKVIGSYLGFGLFATPERLGEEGLWMARRAHITGTDPMGEACRFYVEWNAAIEQHAERRWRVEDVDAQLVYELAGQIGWPLEPGKAEAALRCVDTKVNSRGDAKDIGWDDLDLDWRGRIEEMAAHYGYEVV